MKNKKFFAMVLMVYLTGVFSYATDFTLIGIHESRYIIYGIDFAVKNDASVDVFGISASQKNFGAFMYATTSEDYFEWGASLNYTFTTGKVNLKSIIWPIGWKIEKSYWGIMVGEEATINNPIAPIVGLWAYVYIPDKDFEGLSGHYFFLGTNKEVFGFNLQSGINYNRNFLSPGKGLGGIVGISKTLELNSKTFLDVYFKYYINAEKVNKDEQVVGATISVKL